MKKKTKIAFAIPSLFLIVSIEGCVPTYIGVSVHAPGTCVGYGGTGPYANRIRTSYAW